MEIWHDSRDLTLMKQDKLTLQCYRFYKIDVALFHLIISPYTIKPNIPKTN